MLAILYGQGDFKDTVQIGVLAGWDNDCNPATAGGLIGIINGFSGLPADLTDPDICGDVYKNVYRPYLPDPDLPLPQYDTITNIASRLTDLAEQNILANDGYITFDPEKIYNIPAAAAIIPESENPDPTGPAGLVAEAIDSGITVTPTAAVQRYNTTYDLYNLYSIIDGITDNSYNGHRPYSSYLSDPSQRPQQNWYQLNFSKPLKFDKVVFYEGDIVWQGINTYYKNDDAQGGFFEDLTVEIMRDGQFIVPADLQISPALDRFKMYQTVVLTFAPTVGDAIRIIGTPGGTQRFTTIMELEAYGDIDPGLYIASIQIANGKIQRSSINEIKIEFSHDITITKNNIQLAGTTNATVINMDNVGFGYNPAAHQLTLSFLSSLPDDTYELQLDCEAITDAGNLTLLDDDENPYDGYYTIKFHVLFGDTDGSAMVDMKDFSAIGMHWMSEPADTGLDSNHDNILDFRDLAALTENWLSRL